MGKLDRSLGFIFIFSVSKSLILPYVINLTFGLTSIPTFFLTSLQSVFHAEDKICFKLEHKIISFLLPAF